MSRAAFLLLLVGAASGCGATVTRAPLASGGVVPWANRPLPLYVIPEPKLIRYPTSAPPCRARQLRISQGRTAAGLGNELDELLVTNVGARPCLLRGYPAISAEAPNGRRVLLSPQRGGTYFGRLVPADLAPGGRVFLDLGTSRVCQGGQKTAVRYRRLVFSLPKGGSIRAPHVSISVFCGLSMSEFGLPERFVQPQAARGTPGTLQARVRLPTSIRAGTILRYVVILSNPTKTSIALNPCPGYTEGLSAPGLVVHRSFALNCDSVHAIPAHKHVRYAMRLLVLRRAKPGLTKLGWNLVTPTGPFAGGAIKIRAG